MGFQMLMFLVSYEHFTLVDRIIFDMIIRKHGAKVLVLGFERIGDIFINEANLQCFLMINLEDQSKFY